MRPIVAVIGSAQPEKQAYETAFELGKRLCDAGFRVATGGFSGVMEAALAGARSSDHYREGDTLAILPVYDFTKANRFADIVIPTGLGVSRNVVLVATGFAVVSVAGEVGTLSEIALAMRLQKPVLLLRGSGGWSTRLSERTDWALQENGVNVVENVEQTVDRLLQLAQKTGSYEPEWR